MVCEWDEEFFFIETQHEKVAQLFCEVADDLIRPLCVYVCIMSGLTRPIIQADSSAIWPQSSVCSPSPGVERARSASRRVKDSTRGVYSLWSSFTPIPHQTHTHTHTTSEKLYNELPHEEQAAKNTREHNLTPPLHWLKRSVKTYSTWFSDPTYFTVLAILQPWGRTI